MRFNCVRSNDPIGFLKKQLSILFCGARLIRHALALIMAVGYSCLGLNAATITYSYDTLNRVTNTAYSSGASEQFAFDPNGNRLTSLTVAPAPQSDILPPFLTTLAPANGSTVVTNLISISGTASDLGQGGSGIAAVMINGVRTLNDSVSGNGTVLWSFPVSLLPGSNTFQIVARDASAAQNAVTNNMSLFYAMPSDQPPILNASVYIPGNPFSFTLYGCTNATYEIWASTNLFNWTFLLSNLVPTNGTIEIVDPSATNWNYRFYRAVLTGTLLSSFIDSFDRPDSENVGNEWLNTINTGAHHLVIRNQRLTTQTYNDGDVGPAGIFRPMLHPLPISVSARLTYLNGAGGVPYRYVTGISIFNNGQIDNGYTLYFTRGDANYNDSRVTLNDGQTEVARVLPTFQFTDAIAVQATFNADGSVTGSVQGSGQSFPFSFPAHQILSTGSNIALRLDMPDSRAINFVYPSVDDFQIE